MAGGATFTNSGTIAGGNGGNGGNAAVGGIAGAGGAGGAGIVGQDLSIIMGATGTVSGGVSGGGVQANAITFTGGANSLTFGGVTSGLTGNIAVTGSLTFNQGNGVDTTVANAITGAGSVTKSGVDTVILSGANTYAGGTTVNAGVLQFNQAASIGGAGANVTVAAGGTAAAGFAINQAFLNRINPASAGVVALAAQSSNNLDFNAAGLGNVSLGAIGNAIFSGTLTAAGGNFRLGGGGGNLTVTSNLGGANGLIVGAGGTAPGSVILAGTNTYTGVTAVNAGTLQAGAANIFSANSTHTVAAGATLDLNNFNQTIGSLAGAGGLSLGGATLTAGGDNNSTVFSGAIAGTGGFVKQGGGTQVFIGNNTYTGGTTINAGALLVNGSIADSALTTVGNGAVLGGTGIVGNTAVNGGILSPGNSIGTITVQGSLTLTAGSTYLVEVSPAEADRTNVNGSASLAGTVQAVFLPGTYVVRSYTILSAAGGLGGTQFGALATTDLPAGFDAGLGYQGNDVLLILTARLGALGGPFPRNQQALAEALNGFFNNGGTLPPAFVTLFGLTGNALLNALSQASGEAGASVSQSSFVVMNQFFNAMFDPFAGNRGGAGGPGGALAFAPERLPAMAAHAAVTPKERMPVKAEPFEARWSAWGAGYGGSASIDGNAAAGSHDTTHRAYGFAAGLDRRVTPDTLVGFALAGGGTSFSLSQGLGSGKSDLFQAGVYARRQFGAGYVAGALAYGWQDVSTERTVTAVGAELLKADFDTHTIAGRVEGGWRFGGRQSGIAPYAALQATSVRLPAYSELALLSGAGSFALSYASRTDTQTRSELGARFDHAVATQDDVMVRLHGRAAWAHDYSGDLRANAVFQSLPGAAFTVDAAVPDHDVVLTSAGVQVAWRNGWSLDGTFEGEFTGNAASYAGKGTARYRW